MLIVDEQARVFAVSTVAGVLDHEFRTHIKTGRKEEGRASHDSVGSKQLAAMLCWCVGQSVDMLTISNSWRTSVTTVGRVDEAADREGAAWRCGDDRVVVGALHSGEQLLEELVVENVVVGTTAQLGVVVNQIAVEA